MACPICKGCCTGHPTTTLEIKTEDGIKTQHIPADEDLQYLDDIASATAAKQWVEIDGDRHLFKFHENRFTVLAEYLTMKTLQLAGFDVQDVGLGKLDNGQLFFTYKDFVDHEKEILLSGNLIISHPDSQEYLEDMKNAFSADQSTAETLLRAEVTPTQTLERLADLNVLKAENPEWKELFKLTIASRLLQNEDLHFENFGLLQSREGIRPAPIYDVLPHHAITVYEAKLANEEVSKYDAGEQMYTESELERLAKPFGMTLQEAVLLAQQVQVSLVTATALAVEQFKDEYKMGPQRHSAESELFQQEYESFNATILEDFMELGLMRQHSTKRDSTLI